MAKGFFRGILGILLTVGLLTTTIINCWQFDRMERKQIDLLNRFDEIERAIENGLVANPGEAAPRGGMHGKAFPDYMVQALRDPANLLEEDPASWLPSDAVQGGTLNLKFGSDPKGFNFLTENGADVSEIQAYTGIGLVARHMEDDSKWAPELAYFMSEEIHDSPAVVYDGTSESVTLNFNALGDTTGSTVTITDSAGTVVRTIDGGALEAGEGSLNWDGANDAGQRLTGGFYTFSVAGEGAEVEAMMDTPVTYSYKLRDDFYWHELIGCTVETEAGDEVGVVRELWDTGRHDVLVVEGGPGGQVLIPTVREIMTRVDRAARRIVVDAIPGLIEAVDEPGSRGGS